MNLTFVDGTARQREIWRFALEQLLNMPFDDIPLSMVVEFVDPAELIGQGHTDLARTFVEYDSTDSVVKVRNDAPSFGDADKSLEATAAGMGLEYSAELHFHETAAHETGHAWFAALPHAKRLAIMELFGADTDDPEVIYDDDKPWEDRPGEGMAETFKEAFLPRRFRVLPNRSRRRIPYRDFPKFRSFFRGEPHFNYHYGSNDYRVELLIPGVFHRSDRDPEAFVFFHEIENFTSGYGVDMSQFAESGKLPFSMVEEEEITT